MITRAAMAVAAAALAPAAATAGTAPAPELVPETWQRWNRVSDVAGTNVYSSPGNLFFGSGYYVGAHTMPVSFGSQTGFAPEHIMLTDDNLRALRRSLRRQARDPYVTGAWEILAHEHAHKRGFEHPDSMVIGKKFERQVLRSLRILLRDAPLDPGYKRWLIERVRREMQQTTYVNAERAPAAARPRKAGKVPAPGAQAHKGRRNAARRAGARA